jgi:hypothetical protein
MKTIMFLMIFLIFSNICYSQFSYSSYSAKSTSSALGSPVLTNSSYYSGISLNAGVKFVEMENKSIDFWYVDESPSMDNISKHLELSGDKSYCIGIRLTEFRNNKLFGWLGGGQFYFGALTGIDFEGGMILLGKNPVRKFKIMPEINLVAGNCWKGIGEIQNNDIYIQVNDTKFEDHTNVNVKLSNSYFGIKPGINMSFLLSTQRYLGFRASYQLSVKSHAVDFKGTDGNGDPASDSESLKEKNIGFYVDGISSSKMPFNPDGLEIKITYGF